MKRFFGGLFLAVYLIAGSGHSAAWASPWAEKQGYWAKTTGKFNFGLKNVVWSWTMPWIEAEQTKYDEPWQGFCVGIARTFIYTANGLIHLATFPIPIDFPDVGRGAGLYPKQQRGHYADKGAPGATGSDAAVRAPQKAGASKTASGTGATTAKAPASSRTVSSASKPQPTVNRPIATQTGSAATSKSKLAVTRPLGTTASGSGSRSSSSPQPSRLIK